MVVMNQPTTSVAIVNKPVIVEASAAAVNNIPLIKTVSFQVKKISNI